VVYLLLIAIKDKIELKKKTLEEVTHE